MQLNDLAKHSKINVGVKQSTKAIMADRALTVFIAEDADKFLIQKVVDLASEKKVEIVYVDSMKELGRACNIDVGAATAVIEK
ncbi:ribosomal L7Ae/L30e/S12e/Gadd45 family protein [Fusibacter bizertensis]